MSGPKDTRSHRQSLGGHTWPVPTGSQSAGRHRLRRSAPDRSGWARAIVTRPFAALRSVIGSIVRDYTIGVGLVGAGLAGVA